jgi:Ca2+-transporting ATPase
MKKPSFEFGLTTAEVERQRLQYGANTLEKSKSAFWKRILKSASEPMLLLLFACALIYLFIGDLWSGFVFLGWTTLVLLSSFYRNYRTANVLAALEQFAQPNSIVIRNGRQAQIKRSEVVVGDCVLLREGTRIPADGFLVSGTYLKVDESLLTGESAAIEKSSIGAKLAGGSMVVQGEGIVQISSVGKAAVLGQISTMLKNHQQNRASTLQKSIQSFISWAFMLALGVALLIVLVFALTRGSILQAILNGLSTAMAILPEEFPMVLTLFMSLAAWRLAKKNVLTARISVLESLGSTTVLCTDKTGTLTLNKMKVRRLFPISPTTEEQLQQTARLATPRFSHDAMEDAIRQLSPLSPVEINAKVRQNYPMSTTCFAMAYLYQSEELSYQVHCKGAPEAILKLCKVEPIELQVHFQTLNDLAEQGLRILGFARAKYTEETSPVNLQDFDFELVGFIGFEDPIRRGVASSVRKLIKAGVRVVMITGDYPITARSIAQQAGFIKSLKIINCQELDASSQTLSGTNFHEVDVFARILPAQKLELVGMFQRKGEVVAMIGDGINDAPALQAADIGIAMGEKGADVAREAASLVLLKDQFTEIYSAIEMGRQLILKIQSALLYIIAIHVPIVGLCILPALFAQMPIFLLPFHIAFLELIIDPACALAFEHAPIDKNTMRLGPKKITQHLLTKQQLLKSLGYGLTVFLAVFSVYLISKYQQQNEAQQRLLCYVLLIASNLILILHTLSRTKNYWVVFKESGWITRSILILSVGALMLIVSVPAFRSAFSFALPDFWSSIAAGIHLVVIAVALKWLK